MLRVGAAPQQLPHNVHVSFLGGRDQRCPVVLEHKNTGVTFQHRNIANRGQRQLNVRTEWLHQTGMTALPAPQQQEAQAQRGCLCVCAPHPAQEWLLDCVFSLSTRLVITQRVFLKRRRDDYQNLKANPMVSNHHSALRRKGSRRLEHAGRLPD